ncbi:MAG: ABC transporter ATP-binding protein [Patescibacteria group bacterium]
MENALEVNSLSKKYGEFTAVCDISFNVAPGEIFALIGPNGAGKSTTLKMLSTILQPTSGTASVYGTDIKKNPEKVRRLISYLPEEAGAYKNLSGHEYLEFMAGLYASNSAEQKKYIEFAEKITELGERLKDKIKTYSKGMARKLLLARTVMIKPKLAILDEPTSGLDVINALEIRNTIRGLAKEGMSVLLSSHNMLEIEFLSDKVGIVYGGKLLSIGTATELKKKYNAKNLEEVFMNIIK